MINNPLQPIVSRVWNMIEPLRSQAPTQRYMHRANEIFIVMPGVWATQIQQPCCWLLKLVFFLQRNLSGARPTSRRSIRMSCKKVSFFCGVMLCLCALFSRVNRHQKLFKKNFQFEYWPSLLRPIYTSLLTFCKHNIQLLFTTLQYMINDKNLASKGFNSAIKMGLSWRFK